MSKISRAARDAVRLRLADTTSGFNPVFAVIAARDGLDSVTIDWSASSKQFFQSRSRGEDIAETLPEKYPLVFLYSMSSANSNTEKYRVFSGAVTLALDFVIRQRDYRGARNFEDVGDAFEEAVFSVFNDPAWAASYGAPLYYNGEITLDRGTVDFDAEDGIIQELNFRLTFGVSI